MHVKQTGNTFPAEEEQPLREKDHTEPEDPFKELKLEIESCRDLIYRQCLRSLTAVPNPADVAEDLTQEVMAKALRAAPDFKNESGVKTWMYRIAANAITDYFRGRMGDKLSKKAGVISLSSVRSENDEGDEFGLDLPAGSGNPFDKLRRQEEEILLRQAVEEISDPLIRKIFDLALSDLTQTEIAKELGIPLGTVKSKMFGYYPKLRAKLVKLRELPGERAA